MSFNSKDFKGFTFRSGPVSNKTKSYSSFWDNQKDDYDVDNFNNSAEKYFFDDSLDNIIEEINKVLIS